VGVINAQKVLENTKSGKKATAGLEAFVQERQEIINRDEEAITKLKEQLEKQGTVLSPKSREEKQVELERRIGEYQKRVTEMSREVQKKRGQILREFNDRMEKVVAQIADKEGIALVLDGNSESGAVVYSKGSLDLTDKVIKEYDKITP
jgi:outer membrane protein